MFTNLASFAFALTGLNPAIVPMLAGFQDPRMDTFFASPFNGDEPKTSVSGSNPASGHTGPAEDFRVIAAANPDRLVSFSMNGLDATGMIEHLQALKVNLIIDLGKLPANVNVVAYIDKVPESVAMTALGEALGGYFTNRNGIWVYSASPQNTPASFGRAVPSALEVTQSVSGWPAAGEWTEAMKVAVPATAFDRPLLKVITAKQAFSAPRPTTYKNATGKTLTISADQTAQVKSRGFLRSSDLSSYQKAIVGPLKPGQFHHFGSLKIRG